MYTPENQYRCTIIRGKSQTDMEDLLPLYANIVHKYCPCEESAFKESARKFLRLYLMLKLMISCRILIRKLLIII